MIFRLIAAKWARAKGLKPGVREGKFTDEELQRFNAAGYNCYYLPNYPSKVAKGRPIDGRDIDCFEYVFVDFDLKQGGYETKDQFIEFVAAQDLEPSAIVDSGNGVHVYWRVKDLDAMSYLRLQRRLCRKYNTDEAVAKIYQLLRVPGTVNVKDQDDLKLCEVLYSSDVQYDCETLDKKLPGISQKDEEYCQAHYAKTYRTQETAEVNEELPAKFLQMMKKNKEAKQLFIGPVKDRSKADYRLAHLLVTAGFTQEEGLSVLVNTAKASERSAIHRQNYARAIVEKVWEAEKLPPEKNPLMSRPVLEIIERAARSPKNLRFSCHPIVDATHHGFRLTEVLGLIGGAGAGKTSTALNYFKWFSERNPDYIHLFVSLEQPEAEIAKRVQALAQDSPVLLNKIHILGNYNDDGTYRNLSLDEIQDYVAELEGRTKLKVGCVVIDHIAVLRQETREGESQGLIDICKAMKAFAVSTNTFLIMQSQTSREKAGIGDLELDKDAAYGTSYFEFYCDYIVTTWQPLKRIYDLAPDMTVQAFKACKIRHKDVKRDRIKEDQVYALMYDIDHQELRELTEEEMKAYDHWASKCSSLRNRDRKREPSPIKRIDWTKADGKKQEAADAAGNPNHRKG